MQKIYKIYQCVECGYTEQYGRWFMSTNRRCPECGGAMLTLAEMDQEDRDNAGTD